MSQQPAAYPDAEIRGKLRHWKERLARRYLRVNRALKDPVTHAAIADFCLKGSREGRSRAFAKVARAFGDGVTLEGLRLDGDQPLAVWSVLKPRIPTKLNEANEPIGEHCIMVDYVMAGIMPQQHDGGVYRLADGAWSLEIPDHAAGRMLHRVGNSAALAAIIHEAHASLLRLRTSDLTNGDGNLAPNTKFLVPAGPGGFKCELIAYTDVSIRNQYGMHAVAHTALTEDMLHDDQMMLVPDGAPGERLVDGWLLPKPVKRIVPLDDLRCQIVSWIPGLPDLLVSPKGRA